MLQQLLLAESLYRRLNNEKLMQRLFVLSERSKQLQYHVGQYGSVTEVIEFKDTGTRFTSLQQAINCAEIASKEGFDVTINLADGVYDPVVLSGGSGLISIVGNQPNPSLCEFRSLTSGESPSCLIRADRGTNIRLVGLSFGVGRGHVHASGASCDIADCRFGLSSGVSVLAQERSVVNLSGSIRCHGEANYGWLFVTHGSSAFVGPASVNLTGCNTSNGFLLSSRYGSNIFIKQTSRLGSVTRMHRVEFNSLIAYDVWTDNQLNLTADVSDVSSVLKLGT